MKKKGPEQWRQKPHGEETGGLAFSTPMDQVR